MCFDEYKKTINTIINNLRSILLVEGVSTNGCTHACVRGVEVEYIETGVNTMSCTYYVSVELLSTFSTQNDACE